MTIDEADAAAAAAVAADLDSVRPAPPSPFEDAEPWAGADSNDSARLPVYEDISMDEAEAGADVPPPDEDTAADDSTPLLDEMDYVALSESSGVAVDGVLRSPSFISWLPPGLGVARDG